MGYADVREQEILAAIGRCDESGHELFRAHYGFREAPRMALVHHGAQYDLAAVVGAAHEFLTGQPLTAADLAEVHDAVRAHVERLGCAVQQRAAQPQLLLQPRGGSRDNGPRNFTRTVVNGIRLTEYETALGSDFDVLRSLYRHGIAKLWGSTPPRRDNDAKSRAVRGRRAGDHVLFYANRSFIAEATVLHVFHNPEAAKSIWGTDAEDRTFEHLVALGDVRLLDPPHPATDVLRRVSNRDDLRSLTLVPAAEYANLSDVVPERRALRIGGGPVRRHIIDLSTQELLERVTILNRSHIDGSPSRHQPLTLLWAIGKVVAQAPRLHPWSDFKHEVGAVLAEFGGEGSAATPELPFWHLHRTGVWEVEGLEPAADFEPKPALFDARDPRAGFTEQALARFRSVAVRTRVINALLVRHLADIDDSALLLQRVGLADYATARGGEPSGEPRRQTTTRDEAVRAQAYVKQVKAWYDNSCQLCGKQLKLAARFHSEAAHIRGLGSPHFGPDVLSNLLCLCPNCHVQFDNFAIYIDEDDFVRHVRGGDRIEKLRRHPDHRIDEAHIRRHQSMCETTDAENHE